MFDAARLRVWAAALSLALASGCTTPDAGDSAAPEGGPATAAEAPSAAASPTAEGDTFTVPGTDLVVELPANWSETPLQETRAALSEGAQLLPKGLRQGFLTIVSQIDQGVIVGNATGPVVNETHRPTILVSVESGDASLASAADRRVSFVGMIFPGTEQRVDERSRVALPVGRAVLIRAESHASGAIPTQTIEYVLRLGGTTVSILGTAPSEYAEFVAVMADMAERLRRQ